MKVFNYLFISVCLISRYVFTQPSCDLTPGEKLDEDLIILSKRMEALTLQVMSETTAREEMVRSGGDSGLKVRRLRRYGSRPYHSHSYTGGSFASIHDHSNYIRTVGMGEIIAVLNGVEFRTRHNDYRLRRPSTTSQKYREVEDVPFPPVPPEVLAKTDITEQIKEMREYFRAWMTQNVTHRDYKPYFKPVLCYLEGAWTANSKNVDEPFFSDRHSINAKTWLELLQKILYTSYTGGKDSNENLAYLPTKIMNDLHDKPVAAQWNYRILCHPLSKEVPLTSLHLVDDVHARKMYSRSKDDYLQSRAARFVIKGANDREPNVRNLLDELMEEIPGANNYPASFTEKTKSHTHLEVGSEDEMNVGYYNRVFKLEDSIINRGFNDANLYVALNNQSAIVPAIKTECSGYGRSRRCTKHEIRATWAIPLEIIYTTPLSTWNPYNIKYKGYYKSDEGKTVYAPGYSRNGKIDPAKAYNGANSKRYYITPAAFYRSDGSSRERFDVGVLNSDGDVVRTRASGTYVRFPYITTVGKIRQRYPIAPIYEEGSSTRKELEALKDEIEEKSKKLDEKVAMILQIVRDNSGGVTPETDERTLTVKTGPSRSSDPHTHTILLTPSDLFTLRVEKKTVTKVTSRDANHEHIVVLEAEGSNFRIKKCGTTVRCSDGHSSLIRV